MAPSPCSYLEHKNIMIDFWYSDWSEFHSLFDFFHHPFLYSAVVCPVHPAVIKETGHWNLVSHGNQATPLYDRVVLGLRGSLNPSRVLSSPLAPLPSLHAQNNSDSVVSLEEAVASSLPADSVIGKPQPGYTVKGYSNCYTGQTDETLVCDHKGLLTKWMCYLKAA